MSSYSKNGKIIGIFRKIEAAPQLTLIKQINSCATFNKKRTYPAHQAPELHRLRSIYNADTKVQKPNRWILNIILTL